MRLSEKKQKNIDNLFMADIVNLTVNMLQYPCLKDCHIQLLFYNKPRTQIADRIVLKKIINLTIFN